MLQLTCISGWDKYVQDVVLCKPFLEVLSNGDGDFGQRIPAFFPCGGPMILGMGHMPTKGCINIGMTLSSFVSINYLQGRISPDKVTSEGKLFLVCRPSLSHLFSQVLELPYSTDMRMIDCRK